MATELRKIETNGHSGPMQGPIAPYLVQNPVHAQPTESPGLQLSALWHAFRRSWMLGVLLGIPMIALGLGPWEFFAPKQLATAQVRIDSNKPKLLFDTAEEELGADISSYARLHQTIAQYISNDSNIEVALNQPFVKAALGYPEVETLREGLGPSKALTSTYQGLISGHKFVREHGGSDPVKWVKDNLTIRTEGRNEILPVQFEIEDGELAQAVVNALVYTFRDWYTKDEKASAQERLTKLNEMLADRRKELDDKLKVYYNRAKEVGGTNPETISFDQKSKIDERVALTEQKLELQFERMKVEAQLREVSKEATKQEMAPAEESPQIVENSFRPPLPALPIGDFSDELSLTEETLAEEYQLDLTLRQLERQREDELERLAGLKKRGGSTTGMDQINKQLTRIEEDIELRKQLIKRKLEQDLDVNRKDFARQQQIYELQWRQAERDRIEALRTTDSSRQDLGSQNPWDRQPTREELKAKLDLLSFQEAGLQKEINRLNDLISAINNDAVDLESMKSGIDSLERMVEQIYSEIEHSNIELESKDRIAVVSWARRTDEDDPKKRIVATAAVSLAGFLLPLVLLMWYDISRQHVDDLNAMRVATGLNHMGAIPRLPVKYLKQKDGDPEDRVQRALTESVRGIVAQLIRRKTSENQNCIMVSSARAGEGKTTASIEIAKMLARSGQKTLLVDFDLRRPRLHEEFSINRGPGVYDILICDKTIEESVVQVDDSKLFVLPAGEPDEKVIVESFAGLLTEFFETLRMKYDFVIVDCCPILSVVDGRIIAQYVDGIILAMTRDVSVVPDAIESRDILRSHGASVIGTIVSGQPVAPSRNNPYI